MPYGVHCGRSYRVDGERMVRRKQTPMYWQNGSYGSKIDHITERDLMPWSEREYIKHHSQKSGAFSVEETTEGKEKHDK